MQAPVLRLVKEFPKSVRRNFGVTAPSLQSDPIQELFIQKIREFKKKSESGKPIEMPSDIKKELQTDLNRLEKQYNATGKDMTQIPKMEFTPPKYDPISVLENKTQ